MSPNHDTDTCRLKKEKAALEGHLRRVFQAVDAGLIVFDGEFRIHSINRNAGPMIGVRAEGHIGERAEEFFGKLYPHVSWMLPVVLRTGRSRKTAFSFQDAENDWRYLSVSAAMLSSVGEAEERILVSINDTTDQHKALVKSAQTEKMAAVGLLAAGIAHEFNNIWASVQGYAELAQQKPHFSENLVEVVLEQSQRAAEIIHALLSFSDLQVELKKDIRLGVILKSIKRLVDLELKAKGVDFTLDIREDPPVVGNAGMLQQIFLNLVINAYQAMPDRGTIGISLKVEDGFAVVRVRDDGMGMTEDQIRHLFEPFFTTKGALGGNELVDGHGLGLTLTYNLVQLHGGQITVQSEKGKGSVFTVRMPVAKKHDLAPGGKAEDVRVAAAEEEDAGGGISILVVDDEVVLHGLLTSMLAGHRVRAVATGAEALAAVAEVAFDMIFLDVVLDDMDGLELLEQIRAVQPQARIALVTGRPDDSRIKACRDRVTAVVHKPFSMQDIHCAIPWHEIREQSRISG